MLIALRAIVCGDGPTSDSSAIVLRPIVLFVDVATGDNLWRRFCGQGSKMFIVLRARDCGVDPTNVFLLSIVPCAVVLHGGSPTCEGSKGTKG